MSTFDTVLVEEDNRDELPLLEDNQAPTNQDNNENPMDIDTNLTHIPGVDDTTLLSNVSDEFVLPPIATAGKLIRLFYDFSMQDNQYRLILIISSFSSNLNHSTNDQA